MQRKVRLLCGFPLPTLLTALRRQIGGAARAMCSDGTTYRKQQQPDPARPLPLALLLGFPLRVSCKNGLRAPVYCSKDATLFFIVANQK